MSFAGYFIGITILLIIFGVISVHVDSGSISLSLPKDYKKLPEGTVPKAELQQEIDTAKQNIKIMSCVDLRKWIDIHTGSLVLEYADQQYKARDCNRFFPLWEQHW